MRAPVMAREELPAGGAWDGFDQLTLTASNSWHKVALSRAVTPASFAVLETESQVRLLKSGLYIISALGYFNQTITANTSPGIAIYRNGNQTGAYYGDGGIPRFVYYGNPGTALSMTVDPMVRRLTAGDYFDVRMFQNTGSTREAWVELGLVRLSS